MAENGTAKQLDDASSDPARLAHLEPTTTLASMDASYTSESIAATPNKSTKAGNGEDAKRKGPTRFQQLNKLYALPAPVKTFPLPAFVPHNPLSLVQIVYIWITQTFSPPSGHPDVLYQGWLSSETRSVHVTDQRSIRALWEQGFYGKGSLSRSEPSWLDREKRRKGATASKTSEEVTRQRREERQQIKWERARKEREAIDQRLREERAQTRANLPASPLILHAPTGPLELLSLPNSPADIPSTVIPASSPTVNDSRFPTGNLDVEKNVPEAGISPWHPSEPDIANNELASRGLTNGTAHVNGDAKMNYLNDHSKQMKSPKSVRFSPTVEQATFVQDEALALEATGPKIEMTDENLVIEDLEHLQLSMEEAFFLSYGLGVLNVLEPQTGKALSTHSLFRLFRRLCYFPPSLTKSGKPDDPFMVSYVVYHHFRSLGWVVRGGIKFGVDYLLYNRGPVFSHAEFAVTILRSYSDPYWSQDTAIRDYVAKEQSKAWSWLHCVNRVNAQVKKTLILVYVDIPPPISEDVEDGIGVDRVMGRYKVREIVLKRWISNRSRD